jgi:undecaprenyl phosphate N,N'-diacetylbacillosamine 1-phosphate transferase
MKFYQSYTKPLLDVIGATIGFIVLLPLFLIVIVILFFLNQGKPFYLQRRPGKKEKIFNINKFKTMSDKKDANGNLLSPSLRITKTGQFLRKYSLDEIPQLINVIKGDMSIIGSRPLLMDYLPRYNDYQKQRHIVTPGITGWAQVKGRNVITWEQKFEYDVW